MADTKKMSLICMSGEFDKAIAAFTLASGAAAVNYEVNIFFTFWGLNIIKQKTGRRFLGKGFLDRAFNFMMGGRKTLPLSRLNFGGLSPKLMTGLMKSRKVATLNELFDASLALGVNLYACEMAMHVLGLKKGDFIPEIRDVLGVATFLELSHGGETLFI
ncbi:MAG: DsrE/DsrF/DrsH-like family protein [Kiritimatiellae bacterium]|jgi:peroxiredoxin family protein|nr:DsrE/DsrF/DrsH-like family protein [Kiritimatiellia bacterium]MDY0148457.1 DsrE/DsrF/DrsH-like family protein [Kiritimatiellia bacterium]